MFRRPSITGGILAAGCALVCAVTAAPAAATADPVPAGSGPIEPTTADPASAQAPARADPATAPTESASTVTLITGERVTVSASGAATIATSDQRPGVSYLIQRLDGHIRVVPSDARPLLRSGELDPRLFDVSTLLDSGYHQRDLGLLVTGDGGDAKGDRRAAAVAAAAREVTAAGARVTTRYPPFGAIAARRPAGARQLWNTLTRVTDDGRALRPGLGKIWLDARRTTLLDTSVAHINAPTAWQAGYTGAGVTVAVLDTGVDGTHPDLADRVVDRRNFTQGYEDDRDLAGHGTHIASTIAGSGAASDGKYRGVAPQANLMDGKVCIWAGCQESWILAGMQWAAQQHADIVNLSLGGDDTPAIDPLEQAVNTLTAEYGTLFVIAAGNYGSGGPDLSSPASADAALAVGAMTDTDALASFSKRGPRVGDAAIKPDITAPGVDIVAARGKDAFLLGGRPKDRYATASGTSMATPHVAGAAALLAQARPRATPAELKATLMATAIPNPALGPFDQGSGRVDAAQALASTVAVDPPSLSLGFQRWPYANGQVTTRTVSYRNDDTAPITLELSTSTAGPDGKPAPQGVFGLAPNRLVIEPGESATTTLTTDIRATAAAGVFTGRITATGGPVPLVTPFAITKEEERYDVAFTHIDRAGAPTDRYETMLYGVDTGKSYRVPGGTGAGDYCGASLGDTGQASGRFPAGRYVVVSFLCGPRSAADHTEAHSVLIAPAIELNTALTLSMDARLARPFTVSVAGARAKPDVSRFRWERKGIGAEYIRPTGSAVLDDFYTGQVGDTPAPDFWSGFMATFSESPPEEPAPDWMPGTYHLAWRVTGRVMTGLDRVLGRDDLATVHSDFASAEPDTKLCLEVYPHWGEQGFTRYINESLIGWLTPPDRHTEYFNTDDGIGWTMDATEYPRGASVTDWGSRSAVLHGPRRQYQAGQTTVERWGRAVFGPSLGPSDPLVSDKPPATRTGNVIDVRISMFGDADGHPGSANTEGTTALSRDGTVLNSTTTPGTGKFTVPADTGAYVLSVRSANRVLAGSPAAWQPRELSAIVDAAWTFQSANPGTELSPLPLWAVRLAPHLDLTNTAPAGEPLTIDIDAAPQPGATAGELRTLSVEVSYDDGETWTPVPTSRGPDSTATATVSTPPVKGFASLRTRLEDSDGNTLRQTVTHAYRVAPLERHSTTPPARKTR